MAEKTRKLSKILRYKLIKSNTGAKANSPALKGFTVLVVDSDGFTTLDLTGYSASLIRNGAIRASAAFDSLGVAQFGGVKTPTRLKNTLRIRNPDRQIVIDIVIPAGLEAVVFTGEA